MAVQPSSQSEAPPVLPLSWLSSLYSSLTGISGVGRAEQPLCAGFRAEWHALGRGGVCHAPGSDWSLITSSRRQVSPRVLESLVSTLIPQPSSSGYH